MSPWFSFVVSCIALLISGVTAWFTIFRRGRLVMTQPTVIFFGPDGGKFDSNKSKIYLRTLLYSTAKRGQVLESLHVSLHRNESKQNFNIWVYGDSGNLKRGSGLFVPQEGVTFDHHFLLPKDGANFKFHEGTYRLVLFAKLVGSKTAVELTTISLNVTDNQATELLKHQAGIFFDWGPDQESYFSHIDIKPDDEQNMDKILELMANKSAKGK